MSVEFKQEVLPNGLTVIGEINSESKSVAIGYFVKAGSRDERAGESGLSHFLEHMSFNGSPDIDAIGVNLEFDQMGAQYNAFTSEENTVYYGSVLPEFAPRMLNLWTSLMRPTLNQADFDTEKNVILEEIELYRDKPTSMLFDWARQEYFGSNPLGNSVLGTTESISEMQSSTMRAYHERRYVPSNLVLAFAGNLDWDSMLEQTKTLTADWKAGVAPREYLPTEGKTGDIRISYPKATQSYIALMAPGYSAQDSRRYAANLLTHILGDDGNSRFHWALTDKGLVESIGAGSDEADQDGLFYVFAQCDTANEESVKKIIAEELGKLEQNGVTQTELTRAKNKLATSLVFAGDTPMNRLFSLGMNFVYNQNYEPLSAIAAKVEAVTLEEVNELLKSKPFSKSFTYALVP